ncbi:MAG: hypothetical protein JO309_06215 [Pseudonocardiales bacterium]|nr:hypothetical protein [Pseudonocardiales bacterium]MBV9728992.1 hypothetical protein [Pseudonocardiales bacterium]
MCQSATPTEPAAASSARTFDTTEEFLNAIRPGMELCTSDFTGWASVERVNHAVDGRQSSVRGRRREDDQIVDVPADVLIDLRGGHCVRVDRVRATIDAQGWEVPVADIS